jgi:hypothetical protein
MSSSVRRLGRVKRAQREGGLRAGGEYFILPRALDGAQIVYGGMSLAYHSINLSKATDVNLRHRPLL